MLAQSQIGSNINGQSAFDNFGNTISLNSDGTVLAVGNINMDYVQVYKNTNENWVQLGQNIRENSFQNPAPLVELNGEGNKIAIWNRSHTTIIVY